MSGSEDEVLFRGRRGQSYVRKAQQTSGKPRLGLDDTSPKERADLVDGQALALVVRPLQNGSDREPGNLLQEFAFTASQSHPLLDQRGINTELAAADQAFQPKLSDLQLVPIVGGSRPVSTDMTNPRKERRDETRSSPECNVNQSTAPEIQNTVAPPETLDSIGQDWVHRSKPGIGWSTTRKHSRKSKRPAYKVLSTEDEDEAIADYIRNTTANDEDLEVSALEVRALEANGDDILHGPVFETPGEVLVNRVGSPAGSGVASETSEASILKLASHLVLAESIACVQGKAVGNSEDKDEESTDESLDAVLRQLQESKDGEVAARFAWEEEQGLEDISDIELQVLARTTLSKAAIDYRRRAPQKSQSRRRNQSFPSASALADAVEQDPYGGFDIMDFDRPSLRKKRKGKSAKFEDSESEVNRSFETMWEQDRLKKKQRKADRAELRAQGLLGSKKKSTTGFQPQNVQSQPSDMRARFSAFLGSGDERIALPPMDKIQRKMIHHVANKFGLKSASAGAGANRFVTLTKTSRTAAFDGNAFARLETRIGWAFTEQQSQSSRTRADRGPRNSTSGRATRAGGARNGGGGGGNAAFAYRHGEVVGAAAPEISLENRGRGMLERMGWSAGMALGAKDNKGILEPIAQVVRSSRAGLG